MSSFYEIRELPDGDVVLLRSDDEGEPLVKIRFSAESLAFLGESRFEIAKAMIEAGMDAASELAERYQDEREDFGVDLMDDATTHMLH
jgi:hypothetical protein